MVDNIQQDNTKNEVAKERQLEENPELESLKKFILIQKMQQLNDNLIKHNIVNNSLSIFLDFCQSFSYDTILSVSSGFVSYINQNLTTLIKDNQNVNKKKI
jgi:hypothetical protein